jgi:DNA polymerase-1
MRQVGKTMNFGTLYGAGPTRIAEEANVSIERAQEFIHRYYRQFFGLSLWKDGMVAAARKTDSHEPYTRIPPWGRMRRLPPVLR